MEILKKILKKIKIYEYILSVKFIHILKNKYGEKINKNRKQAFDLHAEECLEKIKEILDEESVKFWLDYGTLLGAIREKDFIKHDLDLDFGINYTSNPSKVQHIFELNDIKLQKEFIVEDKVVEQTYMFKGVTFDIFYYFRLDDELYTYCFTKRECKTKVVVENNKKITKGFKVFKVFIKNRGLEELDFKNLKFYVPENPKGYLVENYGDNYMIPIKEWDYVESPKNMVEVVIDNAILVECLS